MKNGVFFNIRANKAWGDKNNKFRSINSNDLTTMKEWFKSGKFLKYILRDDAAFNIDLEISEVEELIALKSDALEKWEEYIEFNDIDSNHLSDSDKIVKDSFYKEYDDKILHYHQTKEATTGLYSIKGKVSQEELEQKKNLFAKIREKQQIVWSGVISFSEEFAQENQLYHPDKINDLIYPNIQKMLKANNWRKDEIASLDMGWSYHTNTDNPHVHLYFYQKYPTRGEKRAFHDVFSFSKQSLSLFKSNLDQSITKNTEKFNESKTLMRSTFTAFKNEYNHLTSNSNLFNPKQQEIIFNEFLKFKLSNPQIKSKKFVGSLDPETLDKVKNLALETIQFSSKLKTSYNDFLIANKEMADKKFENFLNYYKLPTGDEDDEEPYLSEMDLKIQNIDLNDKRLITDEDDFNQYNQMMLKNEPIIQTNYSNPFEFLKMKKLEFENEHIFSRNDEGFLQGVLSQYAGGIYKIIKSRDIKTPKKQKEPLYQNSNEFYHLQNYQLSKRKLNQLNSKLQYAISQEKTQTNKVFKQLQKNLQKESEKYGH